MAFCKQSPPGMIGWAQSHPQRQRAWSRLDCFSGNWKRCSSARLRTWFAIGSWLNRKACSGSHPLWSSLQPPCRSHPGMVSHTWLSLFGPIFCVRNTLSKAHSLKYWVGGKSRDLQRWCWLESGAWFCGRVSPSSGARYTLSWSSPRLSSIYDG